MFELSHWSFSPLMDFKPIDPRALIKTVDLADIVLAAGYVLTPPPKYLFTWLRPKGMPYKRRMRLHRKRGA